MDATIPHMTEAAYSRVRDALRNSLPPKVDRTWVMAKIAGYAKESSARSLVGQMVKLGLIDRSGSLTEAARLWRLEDSYEAGCEMLMRQAYPADIVNAFSGTSPSREPVIQVFMSRGLGENTARNASVLFLLLANRKRTSSKPAGSSNGGPRRAVSAQSGAGPEEAGRSLPDPPSEPSTEAPPQTIVLRYLLERSRLAELRVPGDLTDRERRCLFRHLEIDLLDEEGVTA